MKKLIILFITALLSFTAYSKPRTAGIGVILGDPTAITGKYFLGTNAVDAGLSYSRDEFILYGDYLAHFPGKFGKQNAFVSALSPYVGIGPVFAFGDGDHNKNRRHHLIEDEDDDFAFGGRIPLGIEWMSMDIPIGVSVEIVPGIVVIPETDAFVQGGVAIRYYF